jgi:hypothetical protein
MPTTERRDDAKQSHADEEAERQAIKPSLHPHYSNIAVLFRFTQFRFVYGTMSLPSGAPTQKDQDCAFLARDALFPLKIQRDGSHPTLFPAAEAAARLREAAMRREKDRADSSFYPRGIVVVHNVNTGELQWNGQPDIQADASISVIPRLLSVRACVCGSDPTTKAKGDAYVQRKPKSDEREIILCSDRLLKKDYNRAKVLPDETPQSVVAVETALAHQMTIIGDQLAQSSQQNATPTTSCATLAAQQVQAARAAECYYSAVKGVWGQSASEVKRGPHLGHAGYSWYPAALRNALQDRCVRAVALKDTVCDKPGEARRCVEQALRNQHSQ